MNRLDRRSRRRAIADMAKTVAVLDVAAHFGVSDSMVRFACAEFDVDVSSRQKRHTLEIISLFCSTTTPLEQIAKRFNRHKDAVWKLYKQCSVAGIPVKLRPMGRPKGEDDATI